jgi:predicted CXXCH cytochrome family protein
MASLIFGSAGLVQKRQSPSFADKLFARATEDDFMGNEACASCHAEKTENFKDSLHAAFVADPKLPLNERGCEGCHGPGGIHQADEDAQVIAFRKMSPKESAVACLRCHEKTLPETHWKGTAHAKADLSCVSCHQIHSDSEPINHQNSLKKGKASDPRKPVFVARVNTKAMLGADEATLCGQCHAPELMQFKLSSHHPIPEGRMACSDCHSVHPSKSSKGRVQGLKEKCTSCHGEVEGPWVYEHDPVGGHSGEGCVECHKPHGSQNPKMLNSFSRGLCAQCHTDKLSTHYPGRTCWTAGCHAAPHGSNSSPNLLSP